jgi:hypothetical protein
MLSMRLVEAIETHWGEIASRLYREVKRRPEMRTLAQRPESELREWCREILENLGRLLSTRHDPEVERRFQVWGRTRFEENVPLHEVILRVQLLKAEIVTFVHEYGLAGNALELYQEEELYERVGRFFDAVVYQEVRGYEEAMRVAHRVA